MGTHRRSFATLRGGLFGLALLALALKVLCPPGVMVAETRGPTPFVICTGHGPLDLSRSSDHPHGGKASLDAPCVFSGGASAAPPTAPLVPSSTAYVYSPARIGGSADLVPGRGLAAPPPPSHGPPRSV